MAVLTKVGEVNVVADRIKSKIRAVGDRFVVDGREFALLGEKILLRDFRELWAAQGVLVKPNEETALIRGFINTELAAFGLEAVVYDVRGHVARFLILAKLPMDDLEDYMQDLAATIEAI